MIDGNVNNLFQDISRIDRTIGDVALRKAFIGISTDNNDVYLGSHLILTEPPKDQNVSVLLFNTDSQTDERLDARDKIESYVVPGIKASWELVGDRLQGQRSIVGYQREQCFVPEIGEVYKITTPDGLTSQFIRITAVDHSVVTFIYHNSSEYVDFNRRKVEMEISASLVTTLRRKLSGWNIRAVRSMSALIQRMKPNCWKPWKFIHEDGLMQLNTITPPDDLLWLNEFEWNPVEQTTEQSLTGALLVQKGQLMHCRPIILSGNGKAGWVSRLTVKSLFALFKAANKTIMLTLPDSRQFWVIFDRSNGALIEAQEVLPFTYPEDSDRYFITLRFQTVEYMYYFFEQALLWVLKAPERENVCWQFLQLNGLSPLCTLKCWAKWCL